jgi:dTDP-4-dehydrorhamnose reductase
VTSAAQRLVWITGAGGLIGSWLAKTAPPRCAVRSLTRSELDLTEFPAVTRLFRSEQPGVVIHCAALSRSPECQANPALAHKLNVQATSHLADLAAPVPFFFFSSDLVFDGRLGNYDETAAVHPLSVYAETKVVAEELVLKNRLHCVIRTSLNAGPSPSGDRGFDEQIHRAWKQGQTLRFFADEFRCPIPAEATARAVWELVLENHAGLFHIAGSERLSRLQIGQTLAARWPELHPRYEPASIADWRGAPRPADTSLNCAKIQRLLSFQLPRWSDWHQASSVPPAGT